MNARERTFVNYRDQVVRWSHSGTVWVDGVRIRRSQRWFWTEEWQEGEREADEAIAAGDVEVFTSGEEFVAFIASLSDSGGLGAEQ